MVIAGSEMRELASLPALPAPVNTPRPGSRPPPRRIEIRDRGRGGVCNRQRLFVALHEVTDYIKSINDLMVIGYDLVFDRKLMQHRSGGVAQR